ncbi:MAG: hypothetical protein RBS73_18270 [Prolixibacteraceae bacterium]|jgi:hypothetical protein|nr:hypothetical protein [Prolixibacteraceae bacterium]
MNDVLMAAVVFFAIYQILKNFTDFLLKRKIIKSGHFEKAEILSQKDMEPTGEVNRYPSLKWGLVAFMGGLGLIVIDVLRSNGTISDNYRDGAVLPIGIELVFISLGFLVYFVIINFSNRKK